MKGLISVLCLLVGAYASASQIILNPGDTNTFGVQLSCEPVGTAPVNPNPPQPPPPPPPRLVGYYESVPNMRCLNGTPKSDPLTIDNYINGCGFTNNQSMYCDSTQVQSTGEDGRCFSMLYSRETLPKAIHPDQMDDLHRACTTTTYACYVNQ